MNVAIHNGETFAPGNTILVCADGGPFTSPIKIPSSGSLGHCISYVGHNHPILYGGRTVTDHSLEGWTADDPLPGVYSRKIKDGGQIYYEDHVAIKRDGHLANHHVCTALCKQPCPEKNKQSSAGSPSCRGGNWFISGGKLYYKPTSGTPADHLLEYSKNTDWAISINDNSYLDFSGLAFTQWWIGISEEPTPESTKAASHITIRDCRGFDLFTGIRLIGIDSARGTSTDYAIHDNTFDYCCRSIKVGAYREEFLPGIVDNVVIHDNVVTHGGMVGTGAAHDWLQAMITTDTEGVTLGDLRNSRIYENTVSGWCRGLVLYVGTACEAHDNTIYSNRFVNAAGSGMILGGPGKGFYGNRVYSNILAYCGTHEISYYCGVYLGNVKTPKPVYNCFSNNILYACNEGITTSLSTSLYWKVTNNIVANSVSWHVNCRSAMPTDFEVDHNLYFPDKGNAFQYGGSSKNFTQWRAIKVNPDLHSPTPADPLFVNDSGSYSLASDFQLQPISPARRLIDGGREYKEFERRERR
jgi:hypothetical protein